MFKKCFPILPALLLLPAFVMAAEPDAKLPPIKVITNAKPGQSIFREASRDEPLVIHSEKDAARHFSGDALANLTKQVDFDQQVVLVFAWRGSGQDKLEDNVLESYPEQVVFRYKPGRTRDLRPHVYVFALRSNVKWRTGAGRTPRPGKGSRQYIRVEIKGTLNAQVAAIGGETTGVTITANGITWELDFGKQAELRKLAEQLHEQQAIVTGTLHKKKGVEIPVRWIVEVTSLKPAGQRKATAPRRKTTSRTEN